MRNVMAVSWCHKEPLTKMVEAGSKMVTVAMLMYGGCEKEVSLTCGL